MKIKSDFVTNSSSTAFIFFFDEKPTDPDKLKKELFGDKERLHTSYGETVDTNELVDSLMEAFSNQSGRNIPSLSRDLMDLVFDDEDEEGDNENRFYGLVRNRVDELLEEKSYKRFFTVYYDDYSDYSQCLLNELDEDHDDVIIVDTH